MAQDNSARMAVQQDERLSRIESEVASLKVSDAMILDTLREIKSAQGTQAQAFNAAQKPQYPILISLGGLILAIGGMVAGDITRDVDRNETNSLATTAALKEHELKGGHAAMELALEGVSDDVDRNTKWSNEHERRTAEINATQGAILAYAVEDLKDLELLFREHVGIEGHPGMLRRAGELEKRILRVEEFADAQTQRSLTSNTAQELRIVALERELERERERRETLSDAATEDIAAMTQRVIDLEQELGLIRSEQMRRAERVYSGDK